MNNIKVATENIKYILVAECYLENFNKKCEELCNDGYTPYGDPFSRSGSTEFAPKYCQAFIKEVE